MITPNNPELYNQKDIQPLKESYQVVNKNGLKGLNWLKTTANHHQQKPIGRTHQPIKCYTQNSINHLKRTIQSRTRR